MLDSKTSEVCRDHDGPTDPDTKKPYTYKKLGANFPTLHPNCRSTTCAFVNEEILAKITRKALDENGNVVSVPGNMTYRQWEAARAISDRYVGTGGQRNEKPLTEEQIQAAIEYAARLGMPRERIFYSDYNSESYMEVCDALMLGTDTYPNPDSKSPNGRLSMKAGIAHEIIGHRMAALGGYAFVRDSAEDEAQASIRAARFASELTAADRILLYRDAITRLHRVNLTVRDVRDILHIKEY